MRSLGIHTKYLRIQAREPEPSPRNAGEFVRFAIEWIPYPLVVGKKERGPGRFTVRGREDRSQQETDIETFIARIRKRTEDMPFRPLPLPERVRLRPLFYG